MPLPSFMQHLGLSRGSMKSQEDYSRAADVNEAQDNVYEEDFIPPKSEDQLDNLIREVKDYQIIHGSLLKNIRQEEDYTVQARPVGVSLLPDKWPRSAYAKAATIQTTFNELYAKVASDEIWFEESIGSFLKQDAFACILWDIHRKARSATGQMPQPLSLGIFRSDYMLHGGGTEDKSQIDLKQVEFNAYSCAGTTHANVVANMHRHLARSGAYNVLQGQHALSTLALPSNDGIAGIVNGLKAAHEAYNATSGTHKHRTGILFIVQPNNTNIADERPIEYALWDADIPTYRVTWGEECLAHTSIGAYGELLFSSPGCAYSPLEASVVYMRAGYDLVEYDSVGREVRLRFEQSLAVKVPSVLGHLTTFKKVQQHLTVPGALEHFLNDQQCADVRSTFMPIYPLDDTETGLIGKELASDPSSACNHVLKPSLEGGGHNIYGAEIPAYLASTPKEQWANYILMEKIRAPIQDGTLMSFRGLYEGPVISELGIVGTCMWSSEKQTEILHNEQVGWTFKSKAESVNEMSVVKGYGCFGSPWLIDNDTDV